LSDRPSILGAVTLLVRAATVAALAVEACAVAVTAGGVPWAPAWRLGLGFRFWRGLADGGAALAAGSFLATALLLAAGRSAPEGGPRMTHRWLWLNAAALALAMLVPAIAAI
jgi:hypothetical protein